MQLVKALVTLMWGEETEAKHPRNFPDPLHRAVHPISQVDPSIALQQLKEVIKEGKDVNATNDSNETPLLCTISLFHISLFNIQAAIVLLEAGADPSIARRHDSATPLSLVIEQHHLAYVRLLLWYVHNYETLPIKATEYYTNMKEYLHWKIKQEKDYYRFDRNFLKWFELTVADAKQATTHEADAKQYLQEKQYEAAEQCYLKMADIYLRHAAFEENAIECTYTSYPRPRWVLPPDVIEGRLVYMRDHGDEREARLDDYKPLMVEFYERKARACLERIYQIYETWGRECQPQDAAKIIDRIVTLGKRLNKPEALRLAAEIKMRLPSIPAEEKQIRSMSRVQTAPIAEDLDSAEEVAPLLNSANRRGNALDLARVDFSRSELRNRFRQAQPPEEKGLTNSAKVTLGGSNPFC